jgi:hypothetical protein
MNRNLLTFITLLGLGISLRGYAVETFSCPQISNATTTNHLTTGLPTGFKSVPLTVNSNPTVLEGIVTEGTDSDATRVSCRYSFNGFGAFEISKIIGKNANMKWVCSNTRTPSMSCIRNKR